MKRGIYTIGYNDAYGHFSKIWEKGRPKRFETKEECEKYIQTLSSGIYKIMIGWNVIKEVEVHE